MSLRHVLVTGGAGFVGSHLALGLKAAFAGVRVTALDNLQRRGSELALERLRAGGVDFQHGDVRCPEDLEAVPAFDLLVECSAEPSVHAGCDGSPLRVVQGNLGGAVHCFEAARRHGAAVLFLSSSRVYPIAALNALPFSEGASRFVLEGGGGAGSSAAGVGEGFALAGPRSYYGATKLAAEHLLEEYVFDGRLRALVYRCGVLAGPWQMGRVDQGFLSLWVARHHFERPLTYVGFGGEGKQVRDVLHVADLLDLVLVHLRDLAAWRGQVYNVGGGLEVSTSLRELTELCRTATGKTVPIDAEPATSPVDVRIYLSDCARVQAETGWRPRRSLAEIVDQTAVWVRAHERSLSAVLA